MSQYILILIWILAMFFVKALANVSYSPVYIQGRKEYRISPLFAVFAFAPVILMTTFRSWIGDSLLSSKIQKNLSEKWHFFKNAAFFDFFEVPVFSRNVANPNFA